jgi:predicted RNA-binding protein (virulence factor B family)
MLKRLWSIKENGGKASLNDNSSPEEIKEIFNISKKAFKRAAGRLLKEGAIEITDNGIKLNWVE